MLCQPFHAVAFGQQEEFVYALGLENICNLLHVQRVHQGIGQFATVEYGWMAQKVFMFERFAQSVQNFTYWSVSRVLVSSSSPLKIAVCTIIRASERPSQFPEVRTHNV
jgi:hypothetical protein